MKRLAVGLFLMLVAAVGFSQESSILQTYLDNFERGSEDVKLRILERAEEQPPEEMGPLYRAAADFLSNNAGRIETSGILREMTQLTTTGTRESGNVEALEPLRSVFENYTEPETRIEVLRTFGALGAEDEETVEWLYDWVSDRNNLQAAGNPPNAQVVRAAVGAMGQISDPSFFEPLLEAILAQYSADVSSAAREAMYGLEGDIVQLAAQSIGNRGPQAKLEALEFFMGEDELSADQKSAVAAAAIRDALATETRSRETQDTLREVRFLALDVISENAYSDATDALISHFNETVLEYDRGQVTRSRVLDAVSALGNMGTEAAAARLSRFLELLNNYTENDRPYDSRIVTATIRNLEKLGYPVAYNPLFYASILEGYPKSVQDAAEEAMQSIQE